MSVGLFARVLDGMVAAVAPPPAPTLPAPSELDAQLTNNAANWTAAIAGYIDFHVRPRYQAVPATAVAGIPAAVPVAWNTESQLRKVLSVPAAAPGPETNSLPLAIIGVLDWKLRHFQRADDVLKGLDLYIAYTGNGDVIPASATTSKVIAKRSMRDLGAFDAFLVRLSASINAAAIANVSLAEVLALYRTEGDLIAPISQRHLDDRLPVNEKLEDISLGLIDSPNVFPTMERGLWSYPFSIAATRALSVRPDALPLLVLTRTAAEQRAKCFALIHWMIVIAGLDFLSNQVVSFDPAAFRTVVTNFMDDNRGGGRAPATMADMGARYDAVFADLTCTWPATAAGRIVVAPNTPVLLASFALTEGMLLLGLDKDKGKGPFIQPIPALKYFAYNLQHARSNVDKNRDRFIHALASAAVAAARSTNAKFASLKAKLAPLIASPYPAGLPNRLQLDPERVSSEHVIVFDLLEAAPTSFLSDAANVALLADFVLKAELADWLTFDRNRGNLGRYQKSLAFYKRLLA